MTMDMKVRPWLLIVLAAVILIGGGFTWWYMKSGKTVTNPTTSPTPTLSAAKKSPTTNPSTEPSSTSNDLKKEACQQLYPDATYETSTSQSTNKIGENFCTTNSISGNFAEGMIGQIVDESGGGPGAHWLGAKVNGKWTLVQASQDTWDCAKLQEFNVPKGFLTGSSAQCYNTTTKQTENW